MTGAEAASGPDDDGLVAGHARVVEAALLAFAGVTTGARTPGVLVRRSDAAFSVVVPVERAGGLFSATVASPPSGPRVRGEPASVLAQAHEVAALSGRAQTVWAVLPHETDLAREAWQAGAETHPMLAVMGVRRGELVVDERASATTISTVSAEGEAREFAALHLDALEPATVEHFARAEVLLAFGVHAVLARIDGAVVGCGMVISAGDAAGIYWVRTAEAARGRGVGGAITGALTSWAFDSGHDAVLLQATTLGRPVYRRLGFRDVGMATRWLVGAS